MRKIRSIILAIILELLLIIPAFPVDVTATAECREVYLGGMPAGFLLSMDGVQVVGLSNIMTAEGMVSPSEEAGLAVGDLITGFDGARIRSVKELERALLSNGEERTDIVYRRGKEELSSEIQPIKDCKTGKYKIGILIRDTVSGVGTVTCIDKISGEFGALGHAVTGESGEPLSVLDGKVYACSIIGVNKGTKGRAGELKGFFLGGKTMGSAERTASTGIFGTYDLTDASSLQSVQTASLAEARQGSAEIYTTIDGISPKKYTIGIIKVDRENKENKNFVIKITDSTLIEATGGIVQGMSGSPIVQDGKLIGAVTHVFLNDPTRGYGIGIDRMFS